MEKYLDHNICKQLVHVLNQVILDICHFGYGWFWNDLHEQKNSKVIIN